MSSATRRTVVVLLAALGVTVLLAWATVAGPTQIVDRAPQDQVGAPSQVERPAPTDADDLHRTKRDTTSDDGGSTTWSADLLTVLGLIASLWFVGAVVRGLMVRITDRLPEKRLVLDVDTLPDGDAEAGRDAMARDADRQRAALAMSDVRNAIVECWVLLEDAAANAGVVRLPSETATEFVVRFLHALDVDPRPVATLARLFHEARFSTHSLGEDARTQALAALDAIHHELAGARA